MLIRLNGTHGSGKSTVAVKIMKMFSTTAIFADGDTKLKKPLGYEVELPDNMLWIVGPYKSACGGCDAIQPFSDIWPRVEMGTRSGYHVLFEGALLSTVYGSIGAEMEKLDPDHVVWAFLDTPLEVCRARVNARRAARGAGPLADFKNVDSKHATIARLADKLRMGDVGIIGGQNTATIRHKKPVTDVLNLLGVKIDKEPK